MKSTVRRAIRRKFVVTMKGDDGMFAGLLTEVSRETLTFEQCTTVSSPDDSGGDQPIAGRVHVFVANVAYLQEIS